MLIYEHFQKPWKPDKYWFQCIVQVESNMIQYLAAVLNSVKKSDWNLTNPQSM